MRSRRVLVALAIAVIGAAYYFCNTQQNPVTGEKQHVALSTEQEVALVRCPQDFFTGARP